MTPDTFKLLRQAHGLTQHEMAERIRVSQPLVAAIECRLKRITPRTEQRVYEAFNTDELRLHKVAKLRKEITKERN